MMRQLICLTASITIASIGQVWAQVPAPGPQQALAAPAPPYANPYPFNALTPEDAYREGLINRWELERFAGPLPQALQGPSVDGSRGNDSGGDGRQ